MGKKGNAKVYTLKRPLTAPNQHKRLGGRDARVYQLKKPRLYAILLDGRRIGEGERGEFFIIKPGNYTIQLQFGRYKTRKLPLVVEPGNQIEVEYGSRAKTLVRMLLLLCLFLADRLAR